MSNNLKLCISEYGKEKRSYSDSDYDRFMEVSKCIILQH